MSILRGLKGRVSIDGISLSCSPRSAGIFLPDTIGKYHRIRNFKIEESAPDKKEDFDKRCKNYQWRFVYEHQKSKNLMWACTDRFSRTHLVPPIYIHFLSSYNSPLQYKDVSDTLGILEKNHGLNFTISAIDVAIDLIHPQQIGLHKRMLRAINPKKKRDVRFLEDKNGKITTTLVMGAPASSNRVTAYDKRRQLMEVKGQTLQEDISRIEIRLKPHALNNSIRTLDDLKQRGWASNLYGRYFSLDYPQPALRFFLGQELSKEPIRKLKGILTAKLGWTPNNFNRDCLREHKRFGPAVRKALAEFKWS